MVLESTPVISFYWSVCYCKWWRHYTWWIEPHWWLGQKILLPFQRLIFFCNIRICVLRFMGELCRADLWLFFFERPHFHNRSEFNRPWDGAAISYYFVRFCKVIIVIFGRWLDCELDFLWKLDFDFGYQRTRQNLVHIRSKSSLNFGSNYKEGKFQNHDN